MTYIIGIDPGKSTGVAICQNGKIVELITTDFWGAVDIIDNNPHSVFVIELPNTKSVWHNGATSKKATQRTGVNVGSCLREAELLINYFGKERIDFCTQKPLGKKTSEQFQLITGWTGRTNQHCRDAALLALSIRSIKK